MGATYPNGGLITETNAQYYAGQQGFPAITAAVGASVTLTCNFQTTLVSAYGLPIIPGPPDILTTIGPWNNVDIYFAPAATPVTYAKIDENLIYVSDPIKNEVTIIPPDSNPLTGTDYTGNFYVQLKDWAVEDNYGSYEYIKLKDVIDNFLVGYVGDGKNVTRVKRTDVMFHAKRGLQEFSYDTLRSIKSQELTIPPSLALPIPQDYVNYVRLSWVDAAGVKRIIYPAEPVLTSNPTELPIQDSDGIPTQDSYPEYESNLLAKQSFTEERWKRFNDNNLIGDYFIDNLGVYDWQYWKSLYGERYGLDPQITNQNGWYTINRRTNMFNFSSNLAHQLVIIEYISDGLAYDQDIKIPKMAEQAIYMHIMHAILSTQINTPEYLVARYKRERSAALRNAKIRLSNIKLEEFTQIMRGKSKWIKH